MQIDYYDAPCGAGKSHITSLRMINTTGRYLVVRDKIDAIEEYTTALTRLCQGRVPISVITAEAGKSVKREVEAIPENWNGLAHCILIITHKALMMADFSGFANWHIIIDETPVIMDQQEFATPTMSEWLGDQYHLTPTVVDGWSSVTLTEEGWRMLPGTLEGDDLSRPIRVFHERVTGASPPPQEITQSVIRRLCPEDTRRAVLVNLRDWSEVEDSRKWSWWSIWSPRQLEAFETITFLANSFAQSFTFELLKLLNPSIVWNRIALLPYREFTKRRVTVRYFAEKVQASTYLFKSEAGIDMLGLVARYLDDQSDQIWMANDKHVEHLTGMGGTNLRPKMAGSNAYQERDRATAIYTAKPNAETLSILKLLGLTSDAWVSSNEFETILQFMCRTSIRDPDSSRDLVWTVFDRTQADYLVEYLNAQPHVSVTLEAIDLGFVDQEKKKSTGRPKVDRTPEQMDAVKVKRREQNRLAQERRRAKS